MCDAAAALRRLYLGYIVITMESAPDPLYDGLPVIIVDEWQQVRDVENLGQWVEKIGRLTDRDHIWRHRVDARPSASHSTLRTQLLHDA